MGIRVEKRHKGEVVEVWLVNSSPHPESISYGGETYVLGARSEALIGTEPAPPEEPTPEEPAGAGSSPEGASTEGESGGRRRGSKR